MSGFGRERYNLKPKFTKYLRQYPSFTEMHILYSLSSFLENTLMGRLIHDSVWLFPVIETVHLFGVVVLVGFASVLDLRLMGVAFKDYTVSMLGGALFAMDVDWFRGSSGDGNTSVCV